MQTFPRSCIGKANNPSCCISFPCRSGAGCPLETHPAAKSRIALRVPPFKVLLSLHPFSSPLHLFIYLFIIGVLYDITRFLTACSFSRVGESPNLEALTDALIWRDLGFASIGDSPSRRKEKTEQNKITKALFSSPNPFMTFFSGLSLPSSDNAEGEAAPGEGTLPTLDGAVALDMKEQTHPALI